MQNILKKIYVVAFIAVLFAPFLLAHREENRIAESENRYYANVPKIFNEEGKINQNYIQDFEEWINDNARFRTLFREIKVSLLYNLFGCLDLENVGIGTNGDLYANAMSNVDTVQGRNLLSNEALESYEVALYKLQKRLTDSGIDFFYMQCYDKITVLNEYYPQGAVQYQTKFIGEHTEDYIEEKGRINIVPLYDMLKKSAKEDNIYYRYIDWCHWNDAGMYLGYEKLMKEICKEYPQLTYLKINDYDIIYKNTYRDVYGFQYPLEERMPLYNIKEKNAKEVETALYDKLSVKEHTHYFVNSKGQKRVLSINDSFIRMGMKNHLAESFSEYLSVDLSNLSKLEWILEEYQPDIVLLECLETNIPTVRYMLAGLGY